MMTADPGLFGPDSRSWQVLRERSVILGGMRALLMQAAHPRIAAAGQLSRQYETDPWGRLERTLRSLFAIVFGTTQEARAAVRAVNRAHSAVAGFDPVTAAPFSARDEHLLLWVHAKATGGAYYGPNGFLGLTGEPAEVRFPPRAMDRRLASRLWDYSEESTGVGFPF
ncbi:oxygenase MpaB family protein [Nonomuraea sp. NPDC002799]